MATQLDAKAAVDAGKNICLTGRAGTGKSTTVQKHIETPDTIKVAPTGIAALNIGAETAHSVFGLPRGFCLPSDINKISSSMKTLFEGNVVDRLVFDEGFMLRADNFDLIDKKLRKVKQTNKPFGGLQVCVCGDGYQFAPIVGRDSTFFYNKYDTPYIFSSDVWQEAQFEIINLTKVYRNDNQEQLEILEAIRTKSVRYKKAVDALNEMCCSEDTGLITLCNYNKDADAINKEEYAKLKTKEVVITGEITGKYDKKDSIIPKVLYLKVGMKVLIAANSSYDESSYYRNGQRGELTYIGDDYVEVLIDGEDTPVTVVRKEDERFDTISLMGKLSRSKVGSFKQIPVISGWATSAHKSQSLTLDSYTYDVGEQAFGTGQVYVAISRATDLRNVRLTRPVQYSDIKVCPHVKKFYRDNGIK